MVDILSIIQKLEAEHKLTLEEYSLLIKYRSSEFAQILAGKANSVRKLIFDNKIYIRGLIEFSNYCSNDCYYCGIRRGNRSCNRYRLDKRQILTCCKEGYKLGFRTFVLQSGEDPFYTDDILCDIVSDIHGQFPDCAITLSIGERDYQSYKRLFNAGANRYLLRHETANPLHYSKLHPADMSYEHRMNCLSELKSIGYQVGCGFMVGSPFQTVEDLAQDLKFIEQFKPDMCGIGPFIPHNQTVFNDFPAGSVDLTCYLLSIIRLINPNILLPATTALGTLCATGRERGVLSGANVVMPNLSPGNVRKDYQLYDNKICTGEEAAECLNCLDTRMKSIGYRIVTDIGNPPV